MTGATMLEDREPGLEDEPFDVVRANSSLDSGYSSGKGAASPSPRQIRSTNRRVAAKANYEVGELPTLSRTPGSEGSTVDVSDSAKNVTGGRSARTRPMSPPSRAGLDDPEVYQRTVQQKRDTEEDEDDDNLTGVTPSSAGLTRGSSYRSEMPMDERQEYEEEMKALALCADVGDASQGVPEFCETAMTSLNEMCAGLATEVGLTPTPSTPKTPKALKLGEKHQASKGGVEEQTAIEVEYVEPLYRGKMGDDAYASPKRKNALLKAMSRKAKDDWKGKNRKAKLQETQAASAALEDLANTDDPHNDNVYATFTNAEKRKFLQLINGGKTPFEATSQVLKDRLDPAAAQEVSSVADSSQISEDAKSPPRSAGSKSRKLAFWKRKSPKGASVPPSPKSGTGSAPTTPSRTLQSKSTDDNDLTNNDLLTEDMQDAKSDGASSCENVGDEIKQFLKEEAESVAAESAGASPKPDTGFQMSGISYYDAVRKDRSMEEDEEYYYNDGKYTDDKRGRKLKLPKGFKGGLFRPKNKATPVSGDEAKPSHGSIATPPAKSFDEEKKAEDAMEDAMAAKLLGKSLPNQMPDVDDDEEVAAAAAKTPKSPEEIVDDLNMDAYLGATETMARAGGVGTSGSFDATSVVSGRSYKTSGTNYTTQSTRSRRPGQAKVRMDLEKSILNTSSASSKTRGWQESIEEVAARTGKVWDPVTGWKDYVDPKKLEQQNSTDGFYSQSVDIQVVQRNASYPEVDSVPSDPSQLTEWKDTRRPRPPTTPSRSAKSGRKSPSRSRAKSPQKGASPEEEKPRGWAATMKAATAKLNMQGKTWDPEKGWTGLSEDETRSVTETQRLSTNDIAMTASSDLQDFGTLTKLDEIANKKDKSLLFLSEEEEAEAQAQLGDGETTDSALSSSAKDSRNSGKYIQIAESGSVREYDRNASTKPIKVRKQNLNPDDAGYFPEGSSHRPIGPVDTDDVYDQESASGSFRAPQQNVVSGPSANKVYQEIYENQENGSFDVATDFSYDDDEAPANSDARKAVPRLKIKIRDTAKSSGGSGKAKSEASFESSTSIPKLAAPKRDTSPIRGNGSRRNASPSEQVSPAPLLASPSEDVDQDEQNVFRPVEEDDIVQPEQPMKETIELKPIPKPSPANAPSPPTQPNDRMSPKLSQLHKMWEKRTKSWDKNMDQELQNAEQQQEEVPENMQNAEWKSFLAKKVEAESAAAGDSVFEFDENGQKVARRRSKPGVPEDGSAFDDLSELSPIRHDDTDSEYGTRASTVHSEASTSVLQGTTFLQRLQACAAPVVTKGKQLAQSQNCGPVEGGAISSHLAFLRNQPGGDKKGGIMQASAGLCGRPDAINEEEDETTVEESVRTGSVQTPTPVSSDRDMRRERSRSNPRPKKTDDMSSVVSDGFGAQSAYLEAIAMKAATGGSKKKKKKSQGSEVSAASSGHSRPSPSEVSGSSAGNSKHSEKFQQFLDRRASKETAPKDVTLLGSFKRRGDKPPTGRQEVDESAEKYASEKVDQMMDSMAGRGRAKEDYEETGAFPTLPGASATQNSPANDASRIAAEELAAARVDVMMQSLSSQNLEDNEAEI